LNKAINIISFDVPYPPNYGGAIDVFYKIKALKKLGLDIYLHTFEYGKGQSNELEKYCKKIYYYKRKSTLLSLFSIIPSIVLSRKNKRLFINLKKNNYPILFEGLHTTYPLIKDFFNKRIIMVRAHNIEHRYYFGLSKSELNILKKIFYFFEAIKLKKYQDIFERANFILTISPLEQEYFSSKYPSKAKYIPVFHQNNSINSNNGIGKFALYHGDLRVPDNIKACTFLIKIFSKINYPLVIASSFNNQHISNKVKKYANIIFKNSCNKIDLDDLIKDAHINILPTFQNTGIKLKLINALYNGKYCLVNNFMVKDTGLEKLCVIANSEEQFVEQIKLLSQQKFTNQEILERKELLANFNTEMSVLKIVELLN
jgi:hypothetical protein